MLPGFSLFQAVRVRALLLFLLVAGCAPTTKAARTPVQPAAVMPMPTPAERPLAAAAAALPEIIEAQLKRLDFRDGAPIVPVRLMEGNTEVTLSSRGRLRFRFGGIVEKAIEGPENTEWHIRWVSGTPAVMLARIQIAEVPFNDKAGLAAAQQEWAEKGLKTRSHILGGVYGIAGKVIDNRRYAVLVDAPPAPVASLAARQAEMLTQFQVRTTLLESVKTKPVATMELIDGTGTLVATIKDSLILESPSGAPIDVRRVEYGVGYDFHNFEDRSFRGAMQVAADRSGKLAVINLVGMEDLLKGLVPSEIFAKAHPEALKAQAVTARGEVLAKIGLKHVADPYFLCSEQHCAVYKGVSGEAATTNLAVEATRGEMSFDAEGKLVDSVYSAVCGGHSENNEVVWGGVANVSLRGRPDVLPGREAPASPSDLKAFLGTEGAYACRLSSFAQLTKFRWEKRFTSKEVDEKLAFFNIGKVFAMTVTERGVSGRARLLAISGDLGATQLRGELTIRRAFGMLNSSMFELKAERDAKGRPTSWVFTGGGWGHGVGLCQTGAIGRADAGQSYREILEHYFNGAQVARVY